MEMLINTSSHEALVLWRLCAAHNGTRELIMRRMSRGEEQGGQLLIFAAFLSIVWRYYFWDVNICVCVCVYIYICVCVCVCVHHWRVHTVHGRNTPAGRKEASECMCSVSANR